MDLDVGLRVRMSRPVRGAVSALAVLVLAPACSANVRMRYDGAGAPPRGGPVSGTVCIRAPISGTTVRVALLDMGRMMDGGGRAPMGAHMLLRPSVRTVGHGRITFLALNRGRRTHELVILPLATGAASGQRVVGADGTVSEAGALGEASSSCSAGPGSGIPAGSASWVVVTLPVGRYELVCNLPNHYADGMHQELDVE